MAGKGNLAALTLRDTVAIVEHAELHLWRELWNAVPATTAMELGLHLEQLGSGCGLMLERIPAWFFNRVIGLGINAPATEEQIQYLVDLYRNRQLALAISLSPHAQPTGIEAWLQQRGFVKEISWAKMIRDNSAPPRLTTDLAIREAEPSEHEQIAKLLCRGFEMPELLQPLFTALARLPDTRLFVAWDGDTPAAAAALTIIDGVGHLNTASTAPEYRQRGAQGALMAQRLKTGIELGCQYFATETGVLPGRPNPSYNNMVRCGFTLAYERPNWVLSSN